MATTLKTCIHTLIILSTLSYILTQETFIKAELSAYCPNETILEGKLEKFKICFIKNIQKALYIGVTSGSGAVVDELCNSHLAPCISIIRLESKWDICDKIYKYYNLMFSNIINALVHGHNYLCESYGEHLKEFVYRSFDCFYERKIAKSVRKCLDDHEIDFENLTLHHFTVNETCGEVVKFITCVADGFRQCPDSFTRTFSLDFTYTVLNQSTGCRKHIQRFAPTTPAPTPKPTESSGPTRNSNFPLLLIFLCIQQFSNIQSQHFRCTHL